MDKIDAAVFLKVVEMQSFRKAADELGYTQAGISYIISAMEESLGLPLFERVHNGVRLSPEGKALLPQIQQLDGWERQFKQSVRELKGLEKGSIKVQIFDSISIHWIPHIIRKFHDDYPGIKIELVSEEDSYRAEQMVMDREVDCGFFLTDVRSDIEVFPLIEENLMAIVAPDHPLAGAEFFPITRIGDYPFISMKYDAHTGIGRIFEKQGVEPRSVFCMDNDYAAMAMVSQGLGFCIFPELLLTDIPYEVRCMEFDVPQKRRISIGTLSMKTASGACRKFIEYTREWVARNSQELKDTAR